MSLARDSGVKVVLDGQGGDEIFAGYTNYAPQHLYGLLGAIRCASRSKPRHWGSTRVGPQARAAARSAVAMRLRRAGACQTVETQPDAALLAPELRELADVSHDEWRLWPRVFDGWLTNVLYWELTRTRLPALLRYEDRLEHGVFDRVARAVPRSSAGRARVRAAGRGQAPRRLVEVWPAAGARRVAATGRRLAAR